MPNYKLPVKPQPKRSSKLEIAVAIVAAFLMALFFIAAIVAVGR